MAVFLFFLLFYLVAWVAKLLGPVVGSQELRVPVRTHLGQVYSDRRVIVRKRTVKRTYDSLTLTQRYVQVQKHMRHRWVRVRLS